ncbi:uncharacterized protein LOC141912144 [Tubulanus polymorphus]|uniref:uncharacterized protein LOC141912144 n=1 Tax=Tubulanus polymorphus TaxID=672921 RepID=UPI003DA2F953
MRHSSVASTARLDISTHKFTGENMNLISLLVVFMAVFLVSTDAIDPAKARSRNKSKSKELKPLCRKALTHARKLYGNAVSPLMKVDCDTITKSKILEVLRSPDSRLPRPLPKILKSKRGKSLIINFVRSNVKDLVKNVKAFKMALKRLSKGPVTTATDAVDNPAESVDNSADNADNPAESVDNPAESVDDSA